MFSNRIAQNYTNTSYVKHFSNNSLHYIGNQTYGRFTFGTLRAQPCIIPNTNIMM